MSDFETKKKLLVAESEVYRELLKLEIQTFKVYGARTKRRLRSFSTYAPWIISGIPVLAGLLKRRKQQFSLKQLSSWFFLGLKAYQHIAPLLRRNKFAPEPEPAETAAEEYLSKRL